MAGKTTLLRFCAERAGTKRCGAAGIRDRCRYGDLERGFGGYFSRDHRKAIRAGVTLIDWLHEFDPMASQAELRGVLGQMLF